MRWSRDGRDGRLFRFGLGARSPAKCTVRYFPPSCNLAETRPLSPVGYHRPVWFRSHLLRRLGVVKEADVVWYAILLPHFENEGAAGYGVVALIPTDEPMGVEQRGDGGDVGVVADENGELTGGRAYGAGEGLTLAGLVEGLEDVKKEVGGLRVREVGGALEQVGGGGMEGHGGAHGSFVDVAPADLREGHAFEVLKLKVLGRGGCGKRGPLKSTRWSPEPAARDGVVARRDLRGEAGQGDAIAQESRICCMASTGCW